MKNMIHKLTAALSVLVVMNACVKPDLIKRNDAKEFADIWAEIPGLKNRFTAAFSPNKDTAYIDMSYFFPSESDNEVDLTNLILRSSVPVDATVTPALGSPMNLSQPVTLTITSGTGESRQMVVVVRKLGDLSVKKAEITYADGNSTQKVEAIPNGDELIFFVIPGTNLTNAQLNLQISKHSQSSIANGSTINLSNPVPVTVTGIDGRTKTYTLVARAPRRLDYGIGIVRKLWQKSGSELGGFGAHTETSIAVSGDHLVLVTNTNPSKYRIYNRHNGEFVGNMTLPFTTYRSFQLTADSSGNLLSSSLGFKNGKFYLYKYKSALDASPVKLVEWTNTNTAADGIVGRRVNIYGDLDKDAIITTTAGKSTIGYKWTIRNGQVESQTPVEFDYKSIIGANWNFLAEAQPIGVEATSNYFLNYGSEIALVSGTANERISAFQNDPAVIGLWHIQTEYFRFNNANFLAIGEFINSTNLNNMRFGVYDVTDLSRITMAASNPNFSKFKVFTSDVITGTSNGNGTGDITYKFSDDRSSVFIYALLTNGGIMAYELTTYAP